jgi:hypothetical protein
LEQLTTCPTLFHEQYALGKKRINTIETNMIHKLGTGPKTTALAGIVVFTSTFNASESPLFITVTFKVVNSPDQTKKNLKRYKQKPNSLKPAHAGDAEVIRERTAQLEMTVFTAAA